MALSSGADLVLELPAAYSSCNAGVFADAAIDILASTGAVDCVSFGTESGPDKKNLFDAIAGLLNEEPDDFKESLKKFLASGYSFVRSRSMAIEEQIDGASELLKHPNNNLALSYIKRIRLKGYPLDTLAIERRGDAFHETETRGGEFASATAIREMAARNEFSEAMPFMPDECAEILAASIKEGHAVIGRDRLWRAVKQAILRMSPEELSLVAEMREGLENRMRNRVYDADSYDSFVDMCTSRRYPRGRIQRYCAHLLLGLRHEQSRRYQKCGPQYIRVLGANDIGRKILIRMRHTATLPVISRSGGRISEAAWEIMRFERSSTEIWETLTDSPRGSSEARVVPILKNY
jgi:predicted nucleotidyltransferase